MLTVTSAILLDAFLTVLGREEMLEELGFFFYIIVGALMAGAAIWLWAILHDFVLHSDEKSVDDLERGDTDTNIEEDVIYQETSDLAINLTTDDLQDLLFDLGYQEEEFSSLSGRDELMIQGIIQLAVERNELESVRIAIERIQNPIPPERLPRLEKLKVDSPPTVFRQYLLANYSPIDIDHISEALGIEYATNRDRFNRIKVRILLSELYERDMIGSLIEAMQETANNDSEKSREG